MGFSLLNDNLMILLYGKTVIKRIFTRKNIETMKILLCFLNFLFFVGVYANTNDDSLEVEMQGLVVFVVDFDNGDKLKLFEVETGDHILSKTHSEVDLSQLPIGSYLLENNKGKSIVINRLEEELNIEGVTGKELILGQDFVLENDSERIDMAADVDMVDEYVTYYENSQTGLLQIEREGDMVTVTDFVDGDKIKLFEVKNKTHILSKTTDYVDLSQLPEGQYLLKNNRGLSVVLEKYVDEELEIAEMQ